MDTRMVVYLIFVVAYALLAIYRSWDNYYNKCYDFIPAVVPQLLGKTIIATLIYFIFLQNRG